jgi:caspase domain-containing protein/FG-GAP repeat protein
MAPDEPTAGRRRALLVATATYSDPGLAALRAPTGDVAALAGVLGDDRIGAFDVRELIDEATDDLRKEIEAFFDAGRPQDLLLLYVSGHGVLSQSRRFYIATRTTSLQLLRSTAIEDSFVNDVMQASRARSIVLVLDCCHSGAFGRGLVPKSGTSVDVEHRFEGRGRVTLSASTELEYAFEEADPSGVNELDPAAPGSLFTRSVVEGLRTGDADVDEDGRVTVDDLYDYVCRRVRERSVHQTPGMAGDVRGQILLARSPRPPRAATEPMPAPAAQPPASRGRPRRVVVAAGAIAAVAAAAIAVVVLLPGGDGGGGAAPPSSRAATPYDFDRDGSQEIVVAQPAADNARIAIASAAPDAVASPVAAESAGVDAEKSFGAGVTSADFDRDGYADIAIGTPDNNAVSVLYGKRGGGWRRPAEVVESGVRSRRFGFAVVGRDVTADGYDDLIVGAPGAGHDRGAVQLFTGSEAGIRKTGSTVERPNTVNDNFGYTLRTGLIDDDDRVDLVEGGPDDPGHLSFCPGTAKGPASCIAMPRVDGDVGTTALAVADVDDDGQDDIVQSDTAINDGPGGVRLWMGGGSPTDTPVVIAPEDVSEDPGFGLSDFGSAVDAGRVDGDGFADIVVGARDYNDGDGAVLVIPGASGGYTNQNVAVLRRPADEGHRFGSDVALLRVDGGNRPQVVVAAENAEFDAAVFVRRGDDVTPIVLEPVLKGVATGVQLGHVAGP